MDRGINTDEVAEPNTFAIQAAEAAFDEGEEWLEELREYLELNREFLIGSLKELVPEVQVIEAEATYLAWIDCAAITEDTKAAVRVHQRENRTVSFRRGYLRRQRFALCPLELCLPEGASGRRYTTVC